MSPRMPAQRAKLRIIGLLLFPVLTVFFSCGDQTAAPWKTGGSSCGTRKDSFIDQPTNQFFTLGRHPWDAARIEVTGTYTICSVMVKLNQKNETAGAPEQNINARIFDHNAELDRPGKAVGNISSTINASTVPDAVSEITFTGLNAPVAPGTYWIVFHSDPTGMEHYLEMQGTNVTERGRALSYSSDVQSINWTEFYYGHINFVLYGG